MLLNRYSYIVVFFSLFFSTLLSSCTRYSEIGTPTPEEQVRGSLVYLEISNSQYDQYQPWRQSEISTESGYGCVVAPDRILTTAENVMHSTFIKARAYGQNTYIPVSILQVDYEYNLCLLSIDPNTLDQPLTPIHFTETYPASKALTTYWLSGTGHVTTSRSTLDRAEMSSSSISFVPNLTFFATNVSRPFGDGELCSIDDDFIGIGAWGNASDSGIIPAETINRFLRYAEKKSYTGFAAAGFETSNLLDPAMRKYLKMPEVLNNGVYVSTVHSLGTGSKEIQPGDVILAVDGKTINPYGRYEHPQYGRISFHHIILQHPDSDIIQFDIFRNGIQQTIDVKAIAIRSDEMLIPYYIYRKQPDYIVTAGFVFQQLTRDYFSLWGNDWIGKVPPHLLYYYSNHSLKPSSERNQIVVLNYVLPTPANLGYQDLSRLVVESVNGKKISSMKDFQAALLNPEVKDFITVTFELDTPTLVIPKSNLDLINSQVAQIYGIPKLVNISK